MDKRKWKMGITLFSIILFGIMISNCVFRGALIAVWMLIGLSAAVSYLSNARYVAAHYGLTCTVVILWSAMLIMVENTIVLEISVAGILFVGMVALYRTYYQEPANVLVYRHILKNVTHLLFLNFICYFDPVKRNINQKEKKTVYQVAVVSALVVLVAYVGLMRYADTNIAYILKELWEVISANIVYILFSIVGGMLFAIALYGFVAGLLDEQLGNRAWCNVGTKLVIRKTYNVFARIYCNPICGIRILNIIIFSNAALFLVNIIYYWNLLGIDFGHLDQKYFAEGLLPMIVIIALNCCIFGGISHILTCGGNMLSLNGVNHEIINKCLLKRCKSRLVIAVLSAFGIWIFAAARYWNMVYQNGINGSNRNWLFWLLAAMIILGYFLIYGFRNDGLLLTGRYVMVTGAAAILIAFLWCDAFLPMYNMFLFQYKMEHGELAYSSSELPDGQIVISTKDINIIYMEKSGLYAVPSLIKLLDYAEDYEGTGGSVSEAALKSIENIFAKEFYEEREEIQKAEGIEKLYVIAGYMQDNPGYFIGIRRYCLQSIINYTSKYDVAP